MSLTGIQILDKQLDRNKTWDVLVRFKTADNKYINFDKYKYKYKLVLKGEQSNGVFFNENVLNLIINDKLPEAILILDFPFTYVNAEFGFPDNFVVKNM